MSIVHCVYARNNFFFNMFVKGLQRISRFMIRGIASFKGASLSCKIAYWVHPIVKGHTLSGPRNGRDS